MWHFQFFRSDTRFGEVSLLESAGSRAYLCPFNMVRTIAVCAAVCWAQVMAVAACCPQLAVPFDGNIAALPRHSFPFGAAYAPVPYLTCTRGQQVFVVSVPHGTIGGRRWRRRPRAETLCVLLLERPDRHVHNGQTSLAPARFFLAAVRLAVPPRAPLRPHRQHVELGPHILLHTPRPQLHTVCPHASWLDVQVSTGARPMEQWL